MNDAVTSTSQSIAVVDDDASLCQALARLLRASGFQPLPFSSAEAFLQAQPGIDPDCLILDIHMPGLSGIELRKKLAESTPSLPVIFITAHDEPETREQAERAGCAAYLRKPVPRQALVEAIVRTLGREATTAEGSDHCRH